MQIELWSIDRVTPYAGNPRHIPEAAVEKVAESIREFSWRQPIVVDAQGVIICGHTRLLAARKLGLAQVPVHIANNLSQAQVRALRLADNRTHEESGWNLEMLASEMLELKELDFDLGLTGFDASEIDSLITRIEISDEEANALPAMTGQPVTRPGDLWLCGPHRILCGDATQRTDVERLLKGEVPRLMVTDPPYGVDYDPCWREQARPWCPAAGRACR